MYKLLIITESLVYDAMSTEIVCYGNDRVVAEQAFNLLSTYNDNNISIKVVRLYK